VEESKLKRKKIDLTAALDSIELAVKMAPPSLKVYANGDVEDEPDFQKNLLRNGVLQIFEYTTELLWKTFQNIFKEEGLSINSPKSVLREIFTRIELSEDDKIDFLKMIDHRNMIAHEYKNYVMGEIYPLIPHYANLMLKLRPLINI
jgi:nucleotidyltransferase substrate binding protein (TIGR01987 family)